MGSSGLLQSQYQDWKPGNSHVPKPFFALGSVTSGPSSGGAIRRLQGKVRVGPGMYFLYAPKNLQRRRFLLLYESMTLWHLKIGPCPLLLQETF